jgi:hypothetical protein
VSLDTIPKPVGMSSTDLVRVLFSAAILGALLMWLLPKAASPKASAAKPSTTLWKWGIWWAVAGWLPLAFPTTGWRPYYGCLGALGAWLAIAVWLVRWPRVSVAIIFSLALVRGALSKTMSWEWSEWYFLRSGSFLEAIRSELLLTHPTLPPHTRLYFARIPNNIGLITAQESALRVWYRDTTMQAHFYSAYRPREPSKPSGKDLFFRFDSTGARALVEIVSGPEDIGMARRQNPEWESDHEKLAMLFLRGGDVACASTEFEKLASLPQRADAALFASVCRRVQGDSTAAESLFESARKRTGVPAAELRAREDELLATMPATVR